ncbi:Uncharacterised protein [Mycobacteroides abscessus]|nr:Uncharacterised protein [Mycobacteroides abscessus]CPZ47696.1 Uncharacterised protein [Mycobacteroides abscessus]
MIKGDKRIGFRIIRGGIAARGGIGHHQKVLGPALLECAVGPWVFGHQINPRTFRQPKCRQVFRVDEDHAAAALYAAIAVVQPIDGGVVLIVAA